MAFEHPPGVWPTDLWIWTGPGDTWQSDLNIIIETWEAIKADQDNKEVQDAWTASEIANAEAKDSEWIFDEGVSGYPPPSYLNFKDVIESLERFDEDYEYEKFLEQAEQKCQEINLHNILSVEQEFREYSQYHTEWRLEWCHEDTYDIYDPALPTKLCNVYTKDRVTTSVEIHHEFPEKKGGYAVGNSIYGKVYIPEKFRMYIPEKGKEITMTCALQDVEPHKGCNPKIFRLSGIYIH